MEPDNQNPPPVEPTDFKKKTIETPILSSDLREKIGTGNSFMAVKPSGGFRDFYKANKIYIWAIGVGVVIIAVLAYFVFRKTPPTQLAAANVNINFLNTVDSAPSGSDAVYQIQLENDDSKALSNLQLEVVYPQGESFVDSAPMKPGNLSGTNFTIPDLLPGQNTVVILKAKVSGNVNDVEHLTVRLHYQYSGYNLDFVKEATNDLRLSASDVAFELDGPTSTSNNQLVIYQVKYTNNSSQDIKNARVVLTFPDGFVPQQSTPPADLGNNTWNLSVVPQGQSGQIQIQGNFSGNAGQSEPFLAEFEILGSDGNYYTQNSGNITTALTSLPLQVSESVTGNTNNVVNPGDTLNYDIHYQNNANVPATGVNITLTLDSPALDLSTLQAQGGQISGNTILWNAASVSNFQSLLPNESGDLNFTVQVKKPAVRDSSTNLAIKSSVKIISTEYQTYFPGNDLALKVSSPASISTGLTFVSGSLPPQVGKATTYKVLISLNNSTNDLGGGVLTAFIPLGPGGYVNNSVNLAENSNVQYDPSTGKLTWNFGRLVAHSGQFTAARTLGFEVVLNPSQSQAGQSPVLVKSLQFTAQDSFTAQSVTVQANNIDTSQIQGQGNNYFDGQVMQ